MSLVTFKQRSRLLTHAHMK